MFSAIHSSALGNSKNNCAKCNPYYQSKTNTMDVSFHPVLNTTGSINYVPLVDDDSAKKKANNFILPTTSVFDDYESDSDSDDDVDMFDLSNDYVKTFYIGSITVVGLYILYRIIDRR
jgi:hypothetical protein